MNEIMGLEPAEFNRAVDEIRDKGAHTLGEGKTVFGLKPDIHYLILEDRRPEKDLWAILMYVPPVEFLEEAKIEDCQNCGHQHDAVYIALAPPTNPARERMSIRNFWA